MGLCAENKITRTCRSLIGMGVLLAAGAVYGYADQRIQMPNVAGEFYPAEPGVLAARVDAFLEKARPRSSLAEVFCLISPHAGYDFSGQAEAYGYKLVQDKSYKTVVILAPIHHYLHQGVSVYPDGKFRTPLGDVEVDSGFVKTLCAHEPEFVFIPEAFNREHTLETQLPFLQRTLKDFRIVPIMVGDCSWEDCERIARALARTIGSRKDVLVVASTDMYHGYDYVEAELTDTRTLASIQTMDAQGLYQGMQKGQLQLCGGFGVVSAMLLARSLGYESAEILYRTTSAEVTRNKKQNTWTVGYGSAAIGKAAGNTRPGRGKNARERKKEVAMLDKAQRKKLLELARNTIETYVTSRRKLEVKEPDPLLNREMGAFVTLHEFGQLRGCIGTLVGRQPLYLTVRDMAIEAATDDPRFSPIESSALKNIEIEISVLSEPQKVDSAEEIVMGKHGVIVKRGFNSGVFLPQVATETGWTKEEFLSHLCSQKAGLAANAWKDKATELYVFTAEVFSEKNY